MQLLKRLCTKSAKNRDKFSGLNRDMFESPSLHQCIGDGDGGRANQTLRMSVCEHTTDILTREPAGILQFVGIHYNVMGYSLGNASDH